MIQNVNGNDGLVGVPPRKRVNAQLDRQAILDATERCLLRKGYDGATIRHIAGELDCAVGSIYRYFADKRELLSVVTQATFEAVARGAESGDALEQTLVDYHATGKRQVEVYALMFWLAACPAAHPGAEQGGDDQAALPDVVRRIITAWSGQLAGGQQAAQRLWVAVHGAILLHQGPDAAIALLKRSQATSTASVSSGGEPQAMAGGHALTPRKPVVIDVPRETASVSANAQARVTAPGLTDEDLVLL